MKKVDGKYHTLYHDLPDEQAQEVLIRMQAMVEEYIQRTRDFSGTLNRKLPFLLFQKKEEYLKAGGMEGTAGVFTGDQLLAIAGDELNLRTWHVIQHEGFHQFARSVIGSNLPIWLNEGLAEYFGEAIFTGDNYVSGVIPFYRMERIREKIKAKQFRSIEAITALSHEEWNNEMSENNYDHAWAIAMFLAHGDNGKYQKAFVQYIQLCGKGLQTRDAWKRSIGSAYGFEDAFAKWWESEDRERDIEPFAQASVQMLTSYLARSVIAKKKVETIDELIGAVRDGSIKQIPSDPLPPGLSKECIDLYDSLRDKRKCVYSLKAMQLGNSTTLKQTNVVCELPDGTVISGSYKLKSGIHIGSVESKITKPKASPATKPAK